MPEAKSYEETLSEYEKKTGHRQLTCKMAGHGESWPCVSYGQDCQFDNLFCCWVCGQAEADLQPKCPGPRLKLVKKP